MSSDEEDLSNNYDEPINEDADNENNEENETEDIPKKDQNEEKEIVKPKRIVRNPQPKLNEETLKGPRGIAALPHYFERIGFKGKGHEEQDLNVILKTYEYWCHRLFPKFPFDSCIEKIEKLGSKKAAQTHIKRIRFDMLLEDKPIIDSSDEDEMENVDTNNFVDNPPEDLFNQLIARPTAPPPVELTEEQLEMIRLNKQKAELLRQEKFKKTAVPTNSEESASFDFESNKKGKNVIKGSTVKKKSRIIPDDDNVDEHNIISTEDSVIQVENAADVQGETVGEVKSRGMRRILDSDDEDNNPPLEVLSESSSGLQNCSRTFEDSSQVLKTVASGENKENSLIL